MAIGIQFDLIGDKRLFRMFNKLEAKAQKKVYKQAARKAAKPILKTSKAKAPTGDTGKLKKFLKIKAIKRSRVQIGVNVVTGTREQMGIPSEEKGYYPAHVELGYKTKSGKVIPAQPYLRNSLKNHRQNSTRIFKSQIVAGIEAEAKKIK